MEWFLQTNLLVVVELIEWIIRFLSNQKFKLKVLIFFKDSCLDFLSNQTECEEEHVISMRLHFN
jgi:hypothetical protein